MQNPHKKKVEFFSEVWVYSHLNCWNLRDNSYFPYSFVHVMSALRDENNRYLHSFIKLPGIQYRVTPR